MSQTTDNERLRATLRAIYDDMHQQNAILANKIERLRADMDQRMNAYVESQERDEAEIERLRGLAKESIAISNDPLLDDDEKVEQMRECTARALETKP